MAVIAIAADALRDTARLQVTLPALTLLTDPSMAVPAAWGQRGDADTPWPGTYVVDDGGRITWRSVGVAGRDWPSWAELATALGLPPG